MILAENGQKDLIFGVGYYYENGIRTSVDYAQAVIWYEKAAKKGHTEAAIRLALLYAQGKGVAEQDPKKAFQYMEQAAKGNDLNALYNMGRCYEEGIGVKPDLSKAMDWYKKAAAQGDFRAMCCLPPSFYQGRYFPMNQKKPFNFLKKRQTPISRPHSITFLYSTAMERA